MPLSCEHVDHDGRACLRLLADDGASALISLQGAQVLSWRSAGGRERLYLSPKADRRPGQAIRGGVPVIFPQFAARAPAGATPLIKHGFARLLDWHVLGIEDDAAVLALEDGAATQAHWPSRFRARLQVALSASSLDVRLQVENRDDRAFAFTAALHTYLRVAALAHVRLDGLQSAPYLDSTRGAAPTAASGEAVRFAGELDRIYAGTGPVLTLHDGGTALRIEAEGFRDTIVWNPGAELAATMGDLGAGEHAHFVCVESGTVIEPVVLAPGQRWSGAQRLHAG